MEEKFEDLVIIGNIENVLYEMEETQVTRLVKFRIGLLARIENYRDCEETWIEATCRSSKDRSDYATI